MSRILGVAVAAMALGVAVPAQALVVSSPSIPASAAADNGFLIQVQGQDQYYPEGPPPQFPFLHHWQWRYRTGDTDITSVTISSLNFSGANGAHCEPAYCVSAWSLWSSIVTEPGASVTVTVVFGSTTQVETVPASMFEAFTILQNIEAVDAPEPASALLLAGGLLGLAARRRR